MRCRNPGYWKRTRKLETTWTDEEGNDFDVEYNFTPGRPARLYGPPEDCYEAEPPEVEILKVTDINKAVRKDIQEFILDNKAAYDQFLENAVIHADEVMESENDYED